MIEADPLLGAALANYPSDRGRLMLPIIGIVLPVALVLNFTLVDVPEWWAAPLSFVISTALALVFGWRALHLWNREVILYEGGFSFREGGETVYFLYHEVSSIRQKAEQLSYFLGLVRRARYQYTLRTLSQETLMLTNLYRNIEQLGERLEFKIYDALRPMIAEKLARGERVSFGDDLLVSSAGLHAEGRTLTWAEFGGYRAQKGRLVLLDKSGGEWYALPLSDVDNIGLLLELFKERAAQAG